MTTINLENFNRILSIWSKFSIKFFSCLKLEKLSKQVKLSSNKLGDQLPLVHFEYEQWRSKIEVYLKFSHITPAITNKIGPNVHLSLLDVNSCLVAIQQFERDYENPLDFEATRVRLERLLHMVRDVLASLTSTSSSGNFELIKRKYDLLRFYHLYLVDVVLRDHEHNRQTLAPIFKETNTMLKVRLLDQLRHGSGGPILSFKASESGILLLNETCAKTWQYARRELLGVRGKAQCCGEEKMKFRAFFTTSECNCFVCVDCEHAVRSRTPPNAASLVCPVCRKTVQLVNRKFDVPTSPGELSIALEDIP